MKNIAVIGPDTDATKQLARQLTTVRALPGAGPNDGIDGVIAVAEQPTEDNLDVVRSIAQTMGTVVVVSDSSWPNIPGVHYCTPHDIAGIEELCEGL